MTLSSTSSPPQVAAASDSITSPIPINGQNGGNADPALALLPPNAGQEERSTTSLTPPDEESILRKKILEIHSDSSLDAFRRAKKIQDLMCLRWRANQQEVSYTRAPDGVASPKDCMPSYHDAKKNILGCQHYRRGIKLQANCCGQWFVCRFCHDDATSHKIIRKDTKYMLCMHCFVPQPAAQYCSHCSERLARYYCSICKFWDDDPDKSIYHCHDCGLCRIGQGLGVDYFHCVKCNACMAMQLYGNHRCIERNLECNCPICGEYLFTSNTKVIFMPCGHSIHDDCFSLYSRRAFQCPICQKDIDDMTSYYRQLDILLAKEQMPPAYRDYTSLVFCNQCEQRCETPYHFLYHKCKNCGSYNVRVLDTYRRENGALEGTDSQNGGQAASIAERTPTTNTQETPSNGIQPEAIVSQAHDLNAELFQPTLESSTMQSYQAGELNGERLLVLGDILARVNLMDGSALARGEEALLDGNNDSHVQREN
ncbi:uncharacterized protein VTP21DRAFT_10202 [Calcarisporiella thermophila]|uniref:uncharacterized protein n=1 Tax=Calcarisporiella thermophila TaxID=911321 RepID=UPI0037436AB8